MSEEIKGLMGRTTGKIGDTPVDSLVMQSAIGNVLTGMLQVGTQELMETAPAGLEKYWHFKWDASRSVEWNVYQFHDLLGLYGRQCRRWEEMHNGCCCVVERVRDKYLMSKIKMFIEIMNRQSAARCAEIAHNWRDEKTGISCCHRLDIEAEIREAFGLSAITDAD